MKKILQKKKTHKYKTQVPKKNNYISSRMKNKKTVLQPPRANKPKQNTIKTQCTKINQKNKTKKK